MTDPTDEVNRWRDANGRANARVAELRALVDTAAQIFEVLSRRINLPPADFQRVLNWSGSYDRLCAKEIVPREPSDDGPPRPRRCECGSDLIRNVDVCMSCERWQ